LFFAMLFIGLIVWGVAAFGIYAIVDIIRRNKNLFKY
jgi:ABC-type polysaccharide/polyol phosphate export permease